METLLFLVVAKFSEDYCVVLLRKVSSHQSQGSSGPPVNLGNQGTVVNLGNQGTLSTQSNQGTLSTQSNQGTPSTLPNQENIQNILYNTYNNIYIYFLIMELKI